MFKQTTSYVPAIVEGRPRVPYDQLLTGLALPLYWNYHPRLESWLPSTKPEQVATLAPTLSLRDSLKRNGFVVLKGLLTQGECELQERYFFDRKELHARPDDMMGIKRVATHNSPLGMYTHACLERFIGELTPVAIKQSYVFSACYEKGSNLPRHVDSREACTWNVSLVVGAENQQALATWPLYIEADGVATPVILERGDAVLYSGIGSPHWRDELIESDWVYGMFFHFAPASYAGSLD